MHWIELLNFDPPLCSIYSVTVNSRWIMYNLVKIWTWRLRQRAINCVIPVTVGLGFGFILSSLVVKECYNTNIVDTAEVQYETSIWHKVLCFFMLWECDAKCSLSVLPNILAHDLMPLFWYWYSMSKSRVFQMNWEKWLGKRWRTTGLAETNRGLGFWLVMDWRG